MQLSAWSFVGAVEISTLTNCFWLCSLNLCSTGITHDSSIMRVLQQSICLFHVSLLVS